MFPKTPVSLKIDVKIKFRAFGITFLTVSDSKTVILPTEVAYIAEVAHFTTLAYNDHGVSITLSLV